jgi:hypothetical protein
MSEQVVETIMRGEPFSLTNDELELDVQPITRTPIAVSAVAWVRYGAVAVKVPVDVVAWTNRAVAIRWKNPEGEIHKAWVWASAVEHEASRPTESSKIIDR